MRLFRRRGASGGSGSNGPADAADPQLTALRGPDDGDDIASLAETLTEADGASMAGESTVSTLNDRGSITGTPKSIKKGGEYKPRRSLKSNMSVACFRSLCPIFLSSSFLLSGETRINEGP